jgi:hypothetical protein
MKDTSFPKKTLLNHSPYAKPHNSNILIIPKAKLAYVQYANHTSEGRNSERPYRPT